MNNLTYTGILIYRTCQVRCVFSVCAVRSVLFYDLEVDVRNAKYHHIVTCACVGCRVCGQL